MEYFKPKLKITKGVVTIELPETFNSQHIRETKCAHTLRCNF